MHISEPFLWRDGIFCPSVAKAAALLVNSFFSTDASDRFAWTPGCFDDHSYVTYYTFMSFSFRWKNGSTEIHSAPVKRTQVSLPNTHWTKTNELRPVVQTRKAEMPRQILDYPLQNAWHDLCNTYKHDSTTRESDHCTLTVNERWNMQHNVKTDTK